MNTSTSDIDILSRACGFDRQLILQAIELMRETGELEVEIATSDLNRDTKMKLRTILKRIKEDILKDLLMPELAIASSYLVINPHKLGKTM
jgi:hypothetical protein